MSEVKNLDAKLLFVVENQKVKSNFADPKLLVFDPDPDPTCQVFTVLDPDPIHIRLFRSFRRNLFVYFSCNIRKIFVLRVKMYKIKRSIGKNYTY